MTISSLNRSVLGRMGRLGFGHPYMTQMKVIMKKIRISAKIGRSIAVFPFLCFLADLPLQLCFNSAYVWIWKFIAIPNKIPYVLPFKWRRTYWNIPILSGSNMCLTFPKFFGASFTYTQSICLLSNREIAVSPKCFVSLFLTLLSRRGLGIKIASNTIRWPVHQK